jgi:hypothetical protein
MSWLMVVLVAPAGCKSGSSSEQMAPWEAARERAGGVYDALAEVAANFPALDTLEPRKCPSPPKWMGAMSWNELARIGGQEPSAVEKQVGVIASVADVGRIHRLPARDETPRYPSASTFDEAVEEFHRRSHLAVLKLRAAKAGKAHGGSTFEAGFLEGWLVVFDLATREPVCQWPVSVQSSQKVSYRSSLLAGKRERQSARRYAVRKDLKDELRRALSEARQQLGAR